MSFSWEMVSVPKQHVDAIDDMLRFTGTPPSSYLDAMLTAIACDHRSCNVLRLLSGNERRESGSLLRVLPQFSSEDSAMAGEDNVSRYVQLDAKPSERRANSAGSPCVFSGSAEYQANLPLADRFLQYGFCLGIELQFLRLKRASDRRFFRQRHSALSQVDAFDSQPH